MRSKPLILKYQHLHESTARQTSTLGYHVGTMWAWMWYPYGLAHQGA